MANVLSRITFILFLLTPVLCCGQDYYMPRNPPPPQQPIQHYRNVKDTQRQKMFFISINAGVSIPTGNFGEKDTDHLFIIPTNNDSTNAKGFANVGFHINAKGGVYLTPNFGIVGKVGFSYNSYDANTLNSIINGYYYYTVNGSYQVWQIMAGPFVNFPINPSTSLRIEGMIGDISTDYPSISVSNSVQTIAFKLSNASNLAYSLSAGIEEVINPTVSFIGGLTYTGSEISYPTCTYTFSGVVTGTYFQHYPVTMSYGSLDLTIGLLFHL